MDTWPVQNAKARFSELLHTCINNGPQLVTLRGEEAAVLVPIAQWKRLLSTSRRPTFKELLMSDEGRVDFEIPKRGSAKRRAVAAL